MQRCREPVLRGTATVLAGFAGIAGKAAGIGCCPGKASETAAEVGVGITAAFGGSDAVVVIAGVGVVAGAVGDTATGVTIAVTTGGFATLAVSVGGAEAAGTCGSGVWVILMLPPSAG